MDLLKDKLCCHLLMNNSVKWLAMSCYGKQNTKEIFCTNRAKETNITPFNSKYCINCSKHLLQKCTPYHLNIQLREIMSYLTYQIGMKSSNFFSETTSMSTDSAILKLLHLYLNACNSIFKKNKTLIQVLLYECGILEK